MKNKILAKYLFFIYEGILPLVFSTTGFSLPFPVSVLELADNFKNK